MILGAGFAGIGAMKELTRQSVNVTLLDRHDYQTFQPLLYQLATDELSQAEVGFPVREMLHDRDDWVFHQAAVQNVDLERHEIETDNAGSMPYDYLVISTGANVNFFGTKGAAENAFPMYTMHDALRLRTHILEQFEKVDRDPSLIDDGALCFCVVGGGATGVETAGALAELISAELKKDYPNLPIDRAEVHLYEMGPTLLAPFEPKLQKYAKDQLEARGVQVHLEEGVAEVEPTRVHLRSNEVVKAHTLVWAAGLSASPIAQLMGIDLVKGRVPVNHDLSLEGHPEVFVVGDIAAITDTETGDHLPQLGSVALQSGHHAGQNISRLVRDQQTQSFKYTDKGTMATIGRGAAIVQLPRGKTLTGHSAWLAWLGVHLMLLSDGNQKSLTFVDWGWTVLSHNRGKRIEVE
ncbi:MAG TPA: NAD(P)/FAD-dependent oxidoreductase [Dehalococcoidia bacterium]